MTSKLTRLLLTLLTFSFIPTVKGETQMCSDLFKDAEVSVLPPNSASPCVSVRLDSGRLQNSVVLTLSINRSSEECTVPTNFLVTLQVINGSGYPVGDLGKSFSVHESMDKSQLAYSDFSSLSVPLFQPSKVLNIPCFRHTEDESQDVTKLEPTLVLIEFSPEQKKAQSFSSRVVWTFSSGNGNSSSAPNQLAALGELVDNDNNKVLQFVSLNQVTLNYSDGCVRSPDSPECSRKQKTIEAIKSLPVPPLKSSLSKRAASNLSQPACRSLKHEYPRLVETPESLECLTLDAYASFSVNNAVFVALTYQNNCPQWKTGEWVLHAYNEKGFPAGTLNKEDSFIHYTEAGDSRRFKCDTSKVATVVKRLDFGKNLQYCRSTGEDEEEWLKGGIDGNAPSLFHAQSNEFYNAGGNAGVFFIWQFVNPTSDPPSLKTIRFVAEAFIPSQSKVLILRSLHEINLEFVPAYQQPSPNPYKSCFSVDNSPTIRRGGPVTYLPDPKYTKTACHVSCLQTKLELSKNYFFCRAWRPEITRVENQACILLRSFPTRQENSAMVVLILDTSARCRRYFFSEFMIQAVNHKGYPVGKLQGSFANYEENEPYKCSKLATPGFYDADYDAENWDCRFDAENKEKYIQEVYNDRLPTALFGNTKPIDASLPEPPTHIIYRSIWVYSQPRDYIGKHPTSIRFVAQVFPPRINSVVVVYVNSPLKLKYIPSPTLNTNASTPCELEKTASVFLLNIGDEVTPDEKCEEIPEICKEDSRPTTPTMTQKTTVNRETTEPNRIPVVIVGKPPPPTLPPLKIKRLRQTDVYDGCDDKKKGCIVPQKGSSPRECFKTRSCELIIAFQRQDILSTDDVVVIEMYHRDPGEWFAIGLNPTQPRMAGAYVLECVDEGHREGPVVYNSYNTAGSEYANQRYYEDGPEGAKLITTTQETYRRRHEIYCRFHIKVKFFRRTRNKEKVFFDLNKQSFFVIAAWGNDQIAGPRGNLRKHNPNYFMRPEDKPSSKTILGTRYAPNFRQSPLIIAHGVLMTWAFVFCIPIGIFTARFFKETFPNVKLFKRFPLWLLIHVASMTLAVMLFVIAMINEIQGHSGWVSQRYSYFHTNFGGILSGLFVLNFAFGFFVKVSKHGQEFTNPAETAHGLLGHFVCLAGFVVILKMDDVSFGNAPCEAKWIVGGMIFSYCVLHGVLTGAKVRLWALIMLTLLGFMYSCWTHITIVFNAPQRPCVPLDRYEG